MIVLRPNVSNVTLRPQGGGQVVLGNRLGALTVLLNPMRGPAGANGLGLDSDPGDFTFLFDNGLI